MAYDPVTAARRRCRAVRKDGGLCRAWAMWGEQTCSVHTPGYRRGRNLDPEHRAELMRRGEYHRHARYHPCTCSAYAWPHRPGGGPCRWPNPPERQHPTPAGTRAGHQRPRPDPAAAVDRWQRWMGRRAERARERVHQIREAIANDEPMPWERNLGVVVAGDLKSEPAARFDLLAFLRAGGFGA